MTLLLEIALLTNYVFAATTSMSIAKDNAVDKLAAINRDDHISILEINHISILEINATHIFILVDALLQQLDVSATLYPH